MNLQSVIFLPCNIIGGYHVRGICCLHLIPEDEDSNFLQNVNNSTCYHDPEDQNLNFHYSGNLKSCTLGEDEME